MKYGKIRRLIFLLLLVTLLLLVPSCGEKPESIAVKIAQEWTKSSIENVSSIISTAVVGNIPGVQQVSASIISDQIRKNITWSYSNPSKLADGRYEVIATASAPIEIKVIVIQQSYALLAEFPLKIDVKNKQVIDWKFGAFKFAKR